MLTVYSGAIEARQEFAISVRSSMIGNATNLVVTALALANGWGLVGLAAALLTSRLVDLGTRFAAFRRLYPTTHPEREVQVSYSMRRGMMMLWCQAGVLAIVSSVLWERSELWFLRRRGSLSDVACYSIAFGLTQQALSLTGAFAQAGGASLLIEQGRGREAFERLSCTLFRYMVLLAFPVTLGLAALSGPAAMLYGRAYAPAGPALTILAVGAAPIALMPLVRYLLLASERQEVVLRWTLLAAGVNLLLDAALIHGGGSVGAAAANVMGQLVALAGMLSALKRTVDLSSVTMDVARTAFVAAVSVAPGALAGRYLPPGLAAVLAIPIACVSYVWLLRSAKLLRDPDRIRLWRLRKVLPHRTHRVYLALVLFLVPRGRRAIA
jgi:O-antigen/teichoic acid export membrane protein